MAAGRKPKKAPPSYGEYIGTILYRGYIRFTTIFIHIGILLCRDYIEVCTEAEHFDWSNHFFVTRASPTPEDKTDVVLI